MRRHHILLSALSYFMVILVSCNPNDITYTISITNSSPFEKKAETIEIQLEDVGDFSAESYYDLIVEDDNGREVLTQLIDVNQDSTMDHLIFQTDFNPGQAKEFILAAKKDKSPGTKPSLRTFCRIVPERMDDFAWENDKVAFRSYGPKCQELFKEGNPAGLISSGIDCWTKRVDYPIIDKWYREDKIGKSYHEDHGEGLDAYHVGTTRGCGGIALVKESKYVLSENFIGWKVLANGPIRSIFELDYSPIKVGENTVTETKRITLDLGAHLYHCKVSYTSINLLDTAAVGIALHQGNGKVASNIKEGWVSYWEPFRDSNLGTAIIADPKSITNLVVNDTLHQDEKYNNIWTQVSIQNNSFNYWSGFGWQKSGDFNSSEDWENYLKNESAKKRNHLQIKTVKN